MPLAHRGFEIVCVELGDPLAAIARRNLAAVPRVRVVTAEFETWDPGEELFDAVVAFTSLVFVRRHLWEVEYTAADYLAVLDTYSGHRSMDEESRRRLYERIRRRIEARPAGMVRRRTSRRSPSGGALE